MTYYVREQRNLDTRRLALPGSFLALDLVLIGSHVIAGVLIASGRLAEWPPFINIGMDWSAGEIANYVKWAVAAAALYGLWRAQRLEVALFFAVTFGLMLLDDSLSIHEQLGRLVAAHPLANGADRATIGVMVLGGYVTIFGIWFALGWRRWGPRSRQIAVHLGLLLAAMAAFAVIADFAHSAAVPYSMARGLWGVIEEGGEMLVLTAIAAYCLHRANLR